MQDLRYAVRQLLKNPGFAVVAVLTLGLGIGVNTAIFSVINAVLLRPLPYPEPGQLVQLRHQAPPGGGGLFPGGGTLVGGREFVEFRDQSRSLARIAAYDGGDFNLTGVDQAERVVCGQVTADFFPLLGIQPAIGRNFTAEEDRPAGPRAVILGHGIWQRRFGGDAGVLGKTVILNRQSYTVVGVLPASFQFPEPFEMWLPLGLDPNRERSGTVMSLLHAVARLKPGVSPAQAESELQTIAQRLQQWGRGAPGPGPDPGLLNPFGPGQGAPTVAPVAPDALDAFVVAGSPPDPTAQPGQPGPGTAAPAPPVPAGAPTDAVPGEGAMVTLPFPGPGPGRLPGAGPGSGGDFQAPVLGPGPGLGPGGQVRLVLLHEQFVGRARLALLVLFAAVGFVLLIACVNVANLLLARAAARQREMAIRAALGAGRGRVVRQLLTESGLLALLGGGFGLLLSTWGIAALRSSGAPGLWAIDKTVIDGSVLGFSLLVCVVTGVVFGLVPALQTVRVDLNGALKEGVGVPGSAPSGPRLRQWLVVSEMALALVLLVGAGLLIRSFVRLREVRPGFQARGVLTLQMSLGEGRFGTGRLKSRFLDQVLERLRALPGVQAAGATDHLPLTDYSMMTIAHIEGAPAPVFGKDPPVSVASVTPDYFRALGIPLVEGRAFTGDDSREGRTAVLVNQEFVRRFLPGQGALGRRLVGAMSDGRPLTIVGVVGDVRQSGLEGDITPEIYRPRMEDAGGLMSLVVRVSADPQALADSVRAVVREVDLNQPVYNVMTMEQRLSNTMVSRRFNMSLLAVFAGLALGLAAVGIYGVMSWSVSRRVREIGVRMALGAQEGDVLRLVVRQGMAPALAGIGLGIAAALALTRYLESLLYAVPATDAFTFASVSALLALVALAACYLPARRAARVDPLEALRCE